MKKTLLTIIAGVGLTFANAQTTIFVSASATGNDDGTSWTDGYVSLQTALTASVSGDEIWVSAGTYLPGTLNSSTFQLKSGVEIYGGFTGNENNKNGVRDSKSTILSGDVDADGTWSTGDIEHIFTATGADTTAVIDGFTIEGGYSPSSHGAAISCTPPSGGVTVRNTIFLRNKASYGGAIIIQGSSTQGFMNFSNCMFLYNESTNWGGAIQNETGGKIYLTNCILYGNYSGDGGYALNDYSNSCTIRNSIMWNNSGGNATQISGNPTISNSIIENGQAGTNVLSSDPMFILNDSIDFRLHPCSPAINTGDTTGLYKYLNQYDLEFNTRVVGTIDMGVYEYNLNNTISINGSKLTAAAMGDSLTYQWINCSNNQPLTGKTSSSYTATASGNYAVIVVTDDSCIIDTSACMSITISGLNEKANNSFSIYPNPTTGAFTINLANNEAIKNVAVYNVLGEEIVNTNNLTIDLSAYTTGVYFLKITLSNNTIISDRIIKK